MHEEKELKVKFGDEFFLKDITHVCNEIQYVKRKGRKDVIGQLVRCACNKQLCEEGHSIRYALSFPLTRKIND